MKISIPEFCLVMLIGASGSGKSTFGRRHFKPTEVLSSDFFRGLIADDETDQSASGDAFELLHLLAGKRLAAGRLTVIDATNVQIDSRKSILNIARQHNAATVAIVFDLGEDLCHERNRLRPDRRFGAHVVHRQQQQLRHSIGRLRDEGFRGVHILTTVEQVDAITIERTPLMVNRKTERGPFDIIGDVHGCFTELRSLLEKLGYAFTPRFDDDGGAAFAVTPPPGRKAVFLGDLVDRGPDSPGVLRLVMNMVEAGTALCVPGNHDAKLLKKLQGRDVNIGHGLALTLEQMSREPIEFAQRVRKFIDGLPSHLVLDGGRLVVAHAGMKESLQGRMSGRVRDFGLYGETSGETDEFGLPVRLNWAAHYRGAASVVYGHVAVVRPEWLNRTICVDTGCVYGGNLTALRYPEQELVFVPAERVYCEAKRPLAPPASEKVAAPLTAQQSADDMLDLADVIGHRVIPTQLIGNVTIREGHAAAALEVMSRFAANPRWLIYLPPTMSPCEASRLEGYLEHPAEAFGYFRQEGVPRVVCQRKHMGSRAVVVVARDEAAARRAFGVTNEGIGICLSRTGRRFFDDRNLEVAFLNGLRDALTGADFWRRFESDWFCLDGELMPWSAKARELLVTHYAAAGAAGRAAFESLMPLFGGTPSDELTALRDRFAAKQTCMNQFVDAYRHYCWPVNGVGDLQYAPFHLLASEGKVHVDQDHVWHMETLAEIASDNGLIRATPYRVVDLADSKAEADATRWWVEMTEAGGEGMVVKPLEWVRRGSRGVVQPALKVRGREYLRIIYGAEYTLDENLSRLRSRAVGAKRSLAVREFALGLEALNRFVRKEPLRRVHECCFGVLALESEPIDPRL